MSRKIMIVEDRESITTVMVEMLNVSGYEVVATAKNGSEALDKYSSHNPDLVLLDLVLPDISGLEVARRILEMDHNARILVVTALSDEGMVKECVDTGCRGFLLKPYRMVEMIREIEKALSD